MEWIEVGFLIDPFRKQTRGQMGHLLKAIAYEEPQDCIPDQCPETAHYYFGKNSLADQIEEKDQDPSQQGKCQNQHDARELQRPDENLPDHTTEFTSESGGCDGNNESVVSMGSSQQEIRRPS